MTRGCMGAAYAAALDKLEIFLTTQHAVPFTAQRLPGNIEGELTAGNLMASLVEDYSTNPNTQQTRKPLAGGDFFLQNSTGLY